jgi:hypothetical protein
MNAIGSHGKVQVVNRLQNIVYRSNCPTMKSDLDWINNLYKQMADVKAMEAKIASIAFTLAGKQEEGANVDSLSETQAYKKTNMDIIPSHIILDNITNNFIFSVKDLHILKLINKDWNKCIKNFKYTFLSLEKNYNKFLLISKELGYNIENIIKNSDINISELEIILSNMKNICERHYGEKYSHLLKQKLIYKYSTDNKIIINTINVFKCIYKYSLYLMTCQKYAPTDISKYSLFWISDYIERVVIIKNPHLICKNNFNNFLSNDNSFIDTIMSKSIDNIYTFYEAIIYSQNALPYIYNGYCEDSKDISKDIKSGLCMWIKIYKLIQSYEITKLESISILVHIMNYIYNNILKNYKIESEILKVFKKKATEFYNETYDSDCYIKQSLNKVTSKIICTY